MQAMMLFTCNRRLLPANAAAFSLALVISFALTGCEDTTADATTAAAPAASAQAGNAASAAPPAALAAPGASTSADADAEDFPAPRPDDSYNTATLRPQYATCVNASGGATPALQACGDEELRYQEDRLAAVVAEQVARPDSKAKDDWMEAQAAWWSDTNRYCTSDPGTEGQGQMLDAQSCRINRVANRVDQLNASTDQP